MNKFDPDALMKAQAERMKRAQAAAEAELRSAGRTPDRYRKAYEAAQNVLTRENPAARPHVIWDGARRASELAVIAVGKESLADMKSGKASGDLRTPDLDFALPLELTELVSTEVQDEIRFEVLQIHAKLLNGDPEFEGCVDNGKHLQALFNIVASKLSGSRDFDQLLNTGIPAMVAAIKQELDWRWPTGNAEVLKGLFFLGLILEWRLGTRAASNRSSSTVQQQGDIPDARHKRRAQSLSPRDARIHDAVGEKNFNTLTNAEIMKDRLLKKRLREDFQLAPGEDDSKSCLNRIRRTKGYPLSRQITEKRSSQH